MLVLLLLVASCSTFPHSSLTTYRPLCSLAGTETVQLRLISNSLGAWTTTHQRFQAQALRFGIFGFRTLSLDRWGGPGAFLQALWLSLTTCSTSTCHAAPEKSTIED